MTSQPGILAELTPLSRYLTFGLRPGGDVAAALAALREIEIDGRLVVGLGASLAEAAGAEVDGLRSFAPPGGPIDVPSTPAALLLWLRGDDRGALVHATRALRAHLSAGLELEDVVDAFVFQGGRDLTGYVDGTENPTGDAARAAALAPDGSSFVAVQRWVHRLDAFEAMSPRARDLAIGRTRVGDEEIEDAPEAAHVKRTAQEGFEPPAFLVRRSMPWAGPGAEGLVFVAFGRSFDAFEALLRRMLGLDDGVVDALFGFTRPVTGAYFWCPPVDDGRLDLRRLGVP